MTATLPPAGTRAGRSFYVAAHAKDGCGFTTTQMNIKSLRASGAAVRALNDLLDEISVVLQTDQGLTDDERRDLNEALDAAAHLVARIETVTS